MTEYWLGRALEKLNDYTKAREAYRAAQQGFRSTEDGAAAAVVIERIAETYTNARELEKAAGLYHLALNDLRRAGNHACEAEALSNLAVTEKQLGNIQKAAEAYGQALPLMRELGRHSDQVILLYNIGQLNSDLGDYRKALQYFEQALKLPAETPEERAAAAWALSGAGLARVNLNDLPGGLQNLRDAIHLARRSGDQRALMMILLRIGAVELSTRNLPEARAHLNEALSTAKKLADTAYQGLATANLARERDLENDPAGAVKLYDQALTLTVGDLRAQGLILYGRAQAKRHLGRLAEALSDVERSTGIMESVRTKTLSDDLRASSFATLRERYELAIDLLMDLDHLQPAEGYMARAFETSERAHGRAVLEELAEAQAGIRAGVDPGLLAEEQDLREKIQLKETERQVQRMERQGPEGQARLVVLGENMAELIARRDWVEAKIRASNPRYANLVRPQARTLKEIQDDLLDGESLLVSYFLGETRSFLWLVDQEGIRSYTLPGRAVIERIARDLQRNLAAGRRQEAQIEVTRAARLLGAKILSPVAAALNGQRLLIIPDGALQEIPFSILSLAGHPRKARALVEDHEIVELPSASVISLLRRGREGRHPPPRTVALFGDAVFRSDDKRVRRSTSDTASAQKPGQSSPESDLGDLPRLISSRREVQEIAGLVPQGQSLVALDFDANLERVLSPEMSQYRILHFATHARLDEHPELSGIVLSQVDQWGHTRDGFLHALDIYNLNLPADLVVLSACQTALGGSSHGEGVGSLTRAFLYAGAKSVVVSLWSVSDQATADLMAHFYEGMLRRGLKPATALREAQLEVRKRPGREAPYYWAGFVLQGDWK